MKIEINNKQLEKQLEEIAQNKYITVELLISEILKEYVEDTSGFEIDNSVIGVRKQANILANEINTKLHMFQNRYEVSVSLSEVTESQACTIIPQRYRVRIIL